MRAPSDNDHGAAKMCLAVRIQTGRRSSVLALMTALSSLSACNIVRIQERSMARKLERRGLQQHDTSLGEDRLRYWEGGDGPPVLLLHGFGAHAIFQWTPQARALAQSFRVVMPDLLWFGGSSSTLADYSLDHQLTALLALLDHLGIERVHVIGVSYGGLLAYELAAIHPQRVERVVIVDSPGRVYKREDYQALLTRFEVEDFGEVLVPDTRAEVERLLAIASYRPPPLPGWAADSVLEELYSKNQREQRGLLQAVVAEADTASERPGALTQPTLLVWGREDPIFPLGLGERLEASLPAAELVVLDEARHAPNVEHAREFNALVEAFLRGDE
nr:alpha/beta hydrolase [Pseudenhygromyxa sp. WMMC2535]